MAVFSVGLLFFDPSDEDPFTLSAGHKQIDATYSTLRRYAAVGVEDINGVVVRLEVCRLPNGLGTTVQAYRRFIKRLNGGVDECKATG